MNPFKLGFCFILASTWSSVAMAAGWVNATVKPDGGPIYRQPNVTSELMGRYPSGMTLRVYSAARNGFYAIYFRTPWKGTQYVWIPADSLDLQGGDQATSQSRRRLAEDSAAASDYFSNYVAATGTLYLFNPSDFQSALGDSSYQIPCFGFDLEYLHRFSRRIGVSLRGGYYSFTNPVVSANNSAITYGANGFTLVANFVYFIIADKNFSLEVEGGGGASLDTVGNNTTFFQISTSQIFGFPIVGSLSSLVRLFNQFYLIARVGYEYHVLSSVPLLVPPTGTTAATSSVTLSAPFASAGLSFQF